MRIIQTMEFTDEDRKLLKQLLPKNPCANCNIGGVGCCGCSEGYAYEDKIRPYKNANIYDIALAIRRIHDIKQNMKQEEDKIKHLMDSIPEELFVNCDNEKGIQILAEDAMNVSDASRKTGKWKNRERLDDYGNAECSECGFVTDNYRAVKIGKSSTDYICAEYHFCPKCGAKMTV